MKSHTIKIDIVRSVCPCGTTSDDLIFIYALSAHGKSVRKTLIILWAERL